MCAKIHSATIATARLRPWPTARSSEEPPEAEYTTMIPRAMVRASAAMSGPSMRRERKSKMRIIMFFRLVLAELRPLVGQLAEQVIVEHLARDRGGGRAAWAAVLHQQGHREPGVVRRRVRDEQRVIAVSLLHALLVVLLALLHGDHLRGAGLGGDGVARARAGARGGPARTRHVDHRGADERQVLGLEHRAFVERALQLADLLGPRILHRLQEPRMYRHAVVGEHGGGNGELQRGGEKISLADSHAHRVAGEPLLLEALPFPVGRRRESVQLAVDVDAGARAEVELD